MTPMWTVVLCALVSVGYVRGFSDDSAKPNIILLLADDLGWNDVGYHGASNILTPNIDRLASQGLRLESHYVMPLCSPTRAALLTGRYPIRSGIQSAVFKGSDTYGLSLDQPLLSETLKRDFGYSTHMVGKWHLGYAAWDYTPTYRGFDSFFGFYLGEQEKWHHLHTMASNDYSGWDLRDGTERADMDLYDGFYSAWMEGNHTIAKLEELAAQHNNEGDRTPFFMYLAYSTPHKPVEAPLYAVEKYQTIVDQSIRREYSAMVDILDDVIGNVMQSVEHLGMWDNTLVVFMSDNGGETQHGDNFPLCGNKNMLYEGGTRSPTFVSGGYLASIDKNGQNGKAISNQLMHVTDWYPTLISILSSSFVSEQDSKLSALSSTNEDEYIGTLDGVDQWSFLNGDTKDVSLRTEFLYNIDPNLCTDGKNTLCGAIRSGKYKYMIANKNDKANWNSVWQTGKPSVECGDKAKTIVKSEIDSTRCQGSEVLDGCLFDLESDPCELFDISEENSDIANELYSKLGDYYSNAMNDALEMMYDSDETNANPDNNDGYWEPWIELADQKEGRNPYLKLKPQTKTYSLNAIEDLGEEAEQGLVHTASSENGKYIIGLCVVFALCSMFVCLSFCRNRMKENKRQREAGDEFSPLLRV